MKSILTVVLIILVANIAAAQELHLKKRKTNALSGSAFAISIMDSTLSLQKREEILFKEIKSGNVPDFLRKLVKITDTISTDFENCIISYWVMPDYLAIGNNNDFFYIPMTPMLAQRVADLTKSGLPTKHMVDKVYANAQIKLIPTPMPPTTEMTTVRYFKMHSDTLNKQLAANKLLHNNGALTAGNKKDLIISNKIYGEKTPRVVIYGWHKPDGKAIQPVYNKHKNTWADYSHGIRLIQNKMWVNGKKTTYQKVLVDPMLSKLLSDEGMIKVAKYPLSAN